MCRWRGNGVRLRHGPPQVGVGRLLLREQMMTSVIRDYVCAPTHVVPTGYIVAWNVLFFTTWMIMHSLYLAILVVACRYSFTEE